MRIIFIVLLGIMVGGCDHDPYVKQSKKFPLPPELEHCKFYVSSSGRDSIVVLHCPNSTTTTSYEESCGKNCRNYFNNIVVDEGEYK